MKFSGALVIREHKGRVFYEAKWRDSGGRQVKRRLGEAWLARDGHGQWRPRRGRQLEDFLDEKAAIVEMHRLIGEREAELSAAPTVADVTFDVAAREWLHHVEHVVGIKPSTLRSYDYMLGHPNAPARKRGRRRAGAKVMSEFGGQVLTSITTTRSSGGWSAWTRVASHRGR